MANVDGQTLLMAVQTVQKQTRSLETQIDQADDDVTDQEHLLIGYTQAALVLRRACEAEELISSNLPPYAMLVLSN